MAKQTKFLLTHTQQRRIHINNPFPPPTQKHHQRSSIHQPRKKGNKKKKTQKKTTDQETIESKIHETL